MYITKGMVQALLDYCKKGFCHGAGEISDGQFCVQQAVNMATTLGEEIGDDPDCVHKKFCGLGIALNDLEFWSSDKARAKGLQRLAVAEMGTEEWDGEKIRKFKTLFRKRLGIPPGLATAEIASIAQFYFENEKENDATYTKVANIAADIIKELGSPGAEFLYLCDEKPMSRQKRVALAMKECKKLNQVYITKPMSAAARMARPTQFAGCGIKFKTGGFGT